MGGFPGAMPGAGAGAAGAGAGAGAAGAGAGAQENPFMMDPTLMQQMMGSGPPMASPAADTRPPREKYASQLAQIKEMGFNDEDAILQILEQTGGNV